ncbi:MAG: SPOR domain-containing protein [Pseudomonadota bacterium]|nr:SPOR domain-containing protein [Pseudomonadota bacterium]
MPKDFSARGPTKARTGKRTKSANKRPRSNKQHRVLFHGPSFSSGLILGAAVVILAMYAPEFLSPEAAKESVGSPQKARTPPVVEFEFPKILKDSEIIADPSAYEVPRSDAPPQLFTIQAASFTNAVEAEGLRAELLLQGLATQIETRLVNDKVWFRVTVGPFSKRQQGNRAMTQLREMNLIPIWISNRNE